MPMPSDSLSNRAFSGLLWAVSGTAGTTVLRFIGVMVLARLLVPEEFGVMAAALAVVGLSSVLTEMGIGPALVQKPGLSREDKHAGFVIALLLGAVLTLAVYSGREVIAGWLAMPQLSPVLAVLSCAFLLRSIGTVSNSLMQRELRFKTLVRIEVLSYAVGNLLVSIVLAWAGAGIWALVFGFMTEALIKTTVLVALTRDSIGWCARIAPYLGFLRFGAGVTLGRFANHVALQADNLVVARLLGATALGFYSRAYYVMVLPVGLIGETTMRVLFPALSQIQGDQARMREHYRRSVALIAMATLPIGVLMLALAPEIVAVVLGDQWQAAVAPIQILSLGLLFRTSYKMSDAVAMACGAVFRQAWRQWVYAALVICGAAVGAKWGIAGVAWGVVAALAAYFLLMAHLCHVLIATSAREFGGAHVPGLVIALLTGSVSYGAAFLCRQLHVPDLVTLLLGIGAMGMALLAIVRWTPGLLGSDAAWILGIAREGLPAQWARFLPDLSGNRAGNGLPSK